MKKIFNTICRLSEFERDLKKLLKGFKTLEEDLTVFIETQLNLYHKLKMDNGGIFQIPGLGIEGTRVYKSKKFACRSLKGRGVNSGIRVIYAYDEVQDIITLIEIYFKGDKENENRERVSQHFIDKTSI